VPQIVAALDPEAGALALLDPAGAVPAAVALIAVQLFPFWKRFILCIRVHILASQLAITSKSNTWLFWLSAPRPLHDRFTGSGCSLCSLSVRLHRVFTDCLKIFFMKSRFSVR
jgi:hypothetical protein